MSNSFVLVSLALCPYVQRAAIVLHEKGVPFERRDVDLADKPDWFLRVSPLGKTPVLLAATKARLPKADTRWRSNSKAAQSPRRDWSNRWHCDPATIDSPLRLIIALTPIVRSHG